MANKTSLKKVDFSLVSDIRCPDCNKLMKVNSINKGHTRCWVCDQVKRERGNKILKGNVTFYTKQKTNRKLNKWIKR